MLVLHSSGRKVGVLARGTGPIAGSAVMLSRVPARPVLSYQQLFVLAAASSHQKSSPLGSRLARRASGP